jgi:hypothetical protein
VGKCRLPPPELSLQTYLNGAHALFTRLFLNICQGVINMHDILSLLVARCKIHVHRRESEAKQLCGGV